MTLLRRYSVAAFFVLAGGGGIQASPSLRVAIYPFDQSGVAGVISRHAPRGVKYGDLAADLIGNSLQEKVQILTRDQMQRLTEEQGRKYDERFDPSKSAEFGKLFGADAILVGSIDEVNAGNASSSGLGGWTEAIGGVIGPRAARKMPRVDTRTDKLFATVRLTAKLIDVSTGGIVFAVGNGSADHTKLSRLKVNNRGGSISSGSNSASDPLIRLAIADAVQVLATELTMKLQTFRSAAPMVPQQALSSTPAQAKPPAHVPVHQEVGIAHKLDGSMLTLLLLPAKEVLVGRTYEVQRPEFVVHPVTGKTIALGKRVGTVVVTARFDDVATGTYKGEPVQNTDRVVALP